MGVVGNLNLKIKIYIKKSSKNSFQNLIMASY
jgi:hypothetical protein